MTQQKGADATAVVLPLVRRGDIRATRLLIEIRTSQHKVREAIGHLRVLAEKGDSTAIRDLAALLVRQGQTQVTEAKALLRLLADNGDVFAARDLAAILTKQGHVNEAVTVLCAALGEPGSSTNRKCLESLGDHFLRLLTSRGVVEAGKILLSRTSDPALARDGIDPSG